MPETADFQNRLRKNARKLKKWAHVERLTAYRLYDRDIPEHPYVVEVYADHLHLIAFPPRSARRDPSGSPRLEDIVQAAAEAMELPAHHVHAKVHAPKKWGEEQYGPTGAAPVWVTVEEHGLKFRVNLTSHLDTGLFMDHRVTRARVREEARGKRFLNLFAYTGAFTVHAAAGGASETTTVDLSKTYLDWARENLELNGLMGKTHQLVRDDVPAWLRESPVGPRYDLVVVDPPSFSVSKRGTRFDIQRDHGKLLDQVLERVAPGGTIYFSTNFRGFELEADLSGCATQELTPRSIPDDFRQKDVHRCWRIQRPQGSARREEKR
jgi:23S rRNA (cytosine1962-C5)-methyltransferase